MTEQLSSMFQDLLSKVSGQEQDWHKVIQKISMEMECKVITDAGLFQAKSINSNRKCGWVVLILKGNGTLNSLSDCWALSQPTALVSWFTCACSLFSTY